MLLSVIPKLAGPGGYTSHVWFSFPRLPYLSDSPPSSHSALLKARHFHFCIFFPRGYTGIPGYPETNIAIAPKKNCWQRKTTNSQIRIWDLFAYFQVRAVSWPWDCFIGFPAANTQGQVTVEFCNLFRSDRGLLAWFKKAKKYLGHL